MERPEFPDIDTVTAWLTEMADELPEEIFRNLNLGILVSEEEKLSPESKPGHPLYILGIYSKSNMGRQIVIYYGSFRKSFPYADHEALKARFGETMRHELQHHLEHQAGEYDLEFEDHLQMQRYRARVAKMKENQAKMGNQG